MKFQINVCAGPSSQGAYSAYRFCQAALTAGHQIGRVFFYSNGVYNANELLSPPSDETDLHQCWRQLGESKGVELVVCIAAAVRRGMLDANEAERYDKNAANISPPFIVSGLGQLVEGALEADRTITFGGGA
ncbi:MAG: sulfurtransferase complex subunit TusD [Cellvibrionaceae bacterium]|nr:sulfurtransferase complex subunit TusD [Cellvibrionaceae bacterium]